MPSSKHAKKTAHDVRQRLRRKPLDLVLFGATGFAGSLVAKYLATHHERLVTTQGLRWGMAGRSQDKLESLRQDLTEIEPALSDLPLLVADVNDEDSLGEMAKRAEVVCSTVGPYSKYGSAVVEACMEQESDYCDLTGEVHWIWRMIKAHHDQAVEKGIRIVHCCGFDSIPSDLGTYLLEQTSRQIHGQPCEVVNLYVVGVKGGFSGGTAASMVETVKAASKDRQVRRVLKDPFSLVPKAPAARPEQREQTGVRYAEDLGAWTGPFVMAAVNERVVRRSNMLLDYPYGEGLRYAEAQAFGPGPLGAAKAAGLTAGVVGGMGAMVFAPTRTLLEKFVLPEAGEGPSERTMDEGFFRLKLLGHLGPVGQRRRRQVDVSVEVGLGLDPGYKGTALMLAEAACCLALQGRELPSPGGVLTPAAAMGEALIDRLKKAGMVFEAVVPGMRDQEERGDKPEG